MDERFSQVGDVELCFEEFGARSDPTVLLIMGLGTQMIAWDEEFCAELVERGFHVVRYDNRDVGRSTHFRNVRPPPPQALARRRPGRVAYTLADMAGDAAGLLDHLGIEAAHVVGASMGGMIAQTLAARHPQRVRSLVSIMSTTGSLRYGQASFRIYPFFLRRPERDLDALTERAVGLFRVIGSPEFATDEDKLREMVSRSYERGGGDIAGTMRQLAAIIAGGNRTRELARIKAPTLVIHGTKDRMIRVSGGKATARAIPGARLMLIKGMGHDLPRALWPRFADAIAEHARAAKGEQRARPAAAPTADPAHQPA